MSTPRPGWYPDPAGTEDLFRYWDGEAWTDAISESPAAPAPRAPEPGRSTGATPTDDPDPTPDIPPVPAAGVRSTGGARSRTGTGGGSRLRVVVALTLGAALLVTAGLGASGHLLGDRHDRSSEPATERPGRTVGPSDATDTRPPMGSVDEETGEARIGDVEMTLPGDPYDVYAGSAPVRDAFDIFFSANAKVHRHFQGNRDWVATVGLAHIAPEITDRGTDQEAAEEAMRAVTKHFFGNHKTTRKNLKSSVGLVDGRPAVTVTVDVHYKIKQLPSTHDRVTAVLVQLDDGSMVAAVSSVPNDAPPEIHRQAADSLGSLRFR